MQGHENLSSPPHSMPGMLMNLLNNCWAQRLAAEEESDCRDEDGHSDGNDDDDDDGRAEDPINIF